MEENFRKIFFAIVLILGICHEIRATVDAHRTATYDFAVTNKCRQQQEIAKVVSSCACLKVDSPQTQLAPVASVPLTVTFDPAGMEGPVRKTVDVTLSPSGETLTFVIEANVRLRLGYKPSDAAFGVVSRKDMGRKIEAKLSGYVANATKVVGVVPPQSPIFDLKVEGGSLVASFRDPAVAAGTYAETWTVKTSDPEIPEIKFPVSARVSDALEVTPQVLTVGWNESVSSRMVSLRAKGRCGFKILSAETKPRTWGTARIEQRPLNGWRIVIDGIDPREVRQFSKKPFLEVKTDLPEMELVEIPLRVVNKGGES